jgi:1,4-dihydroxy-2-naphthoyl-CoA synthase
MSNFKVLSIGECDDYDYGKSIVQYQHGSIISFTFCDVDVRNGVTPEKVEEVVKWLETNHSTNIPSISWKSLSPALVYLILDNPFDMNFIKEGDSEIWTQDVAYKLDDEVSKLNLTDVIICGEGEEMLTVYAGAMSVVDWTGHPQYGVPFLEYMQ